MNVKIFLALLQLAAASRLRKSLPTAALTTEHAGSTVLHHLSMNNSCHDCCNSGLSRATCFDVEQCSHHGPENGKYALVLSFAGNPAYINLRYIESMRAAADEAGKADILLMMTEKDADNKGKGIPAKLQTVLDTYGVKLLKVPWAVPPKMKFTRPQNWCGTKDFIRLHALGLEGYDAIAYYDDDIDFRGSIAPVLKCAAQGKMITTSGGIGEPLNVGFFALKPNKKLLQAAVHFAQDASYSEKDGWGKSGWAPSGDYYVGSECGQGFMYTLFYTSHEISQQSFKKAGLPVGSSSFQAVQVDRCIWNYQTASNCEHFDCARVRAHHKPVRTNDKSKNQKECMKLHML
eukprot:TRINITY_DN3865_c0_g1_i1.p1 TRINITY_DN3865_c0_g1~~TRINITY_DN3865_c0_g1_i1.p1  ORF type:complete len:376 (+),score=82.51 TRINITY_DN3865_c0_g1_i1:89-1129(+)